jgi:hypothetical protein
LRPEGLGGMGNALQMAYIHTELRQAVPLIRDPGPKLLTTPARIVGILTG